MPFQKAVRTQARARVAIDGPAKAGKSFTSLRLAFALGGKVAAIDTEFGSLSKYAGDNPDGEGPFEFDVLQLRTFSPQDYVNALREAERCRYNVAVIDSLSHAWIGEGGILDQADRSTKNGFTKWADLTPQHRRLVDTIQASSLHVVCTMRTKMDWVLEKNEKTGKMEPRKVGLAPVQREGMEYEFDLLCSINQEHLLTVSGSRCPAMDGAAAPKPGAMFFRPYVEWLGTGAEPTPQPATGPAPTANGSHVSPTLAELKRLHGLSGISAADWQSLLSRYGVASATQLTDGQQQDVLAQLRLHIQRTSSTLQEAMATASGGANG